MDGKMKESNKGTVKEAKFMAVRLVHHRPIKPNGVGDCTVTGRANWCTGWHRALLVYLYECVNAGETVRDEVCVCAKHGWMVE